MLGLLADARRHPRRPSSPTSIYSPRNCDAARQLFRVTAGLESMIVGEAEVQGQVRRAHELALDAGIDRAADATACSPRRCRPASACAPRPAIGRGRVSVSSVAVDARREASATSPTATS